MALWFGSSYLQPHAYEYIAVHEEQRPLRGIMNFQLAVLISSSMKSAL